MVVIADRNETELWLRDEKYILFMADKTKFLEYLECNYFRPGTHKNSEFEAALIPIDGVITGWCRIKDSEENRELVYDAFQNFFGEMSSRKEFDDLVDKNKQSAKQIVLHLGD